MTDWNSDEQLAQHLDTFAVVLFEDEGNAKTDSGRLHAVLSNVPMNAELRKVTFVIDAGERHTELDQGHSAALYESFKRWIRLSC
jgi:hypothetical protein